MKYIIFIILFIPFVGSTQSVKDLKNELKNLAKDQGLENALISFYALDVDSNQVIANWNENKSMIPASVLKLVTTATALEVLGEGKRFPTSIEYTGKIDSNNVLQGDIYIKGGGDPSLGSNRFGKSNINIINRWANAIIDLGIDSINGQIIGDASIFNKSMIPSTWTWSDMGNYYGAGPCGLSIYENTYKIELESGKHKGGSTVVDCIIPYIPEMKLKNNVKSMNIRSDQSYIFGAPYQNERVIRGSIPLNKKQFTVKGSIPDPSFLVAFELEMKLRSLKVKSSNRATTLRRLQKESEEKRSLILNTYSPKLIKLAQQTNLYSINLYAEHIMNHLGIHKYNKGSVEYGIKGTKNFLKKKGIDTKGMHLYDGSGLSRFNAITSKQLVGLLNVMYKSKNKDLFLSTLPIAGKSGTLRSVGKGTAIANKIKAKSGSMTRVRSYAGYATTKNNRNIAFTLIVNNYTCSAYQMRKKMEKIMSKIVEIKE